MGKYTKEDIIRLVEEEDVEFIRLQFTDIFGVVKNIAITSSQLERALNNRCVFDGSSIDGFIRIEESDMYLYPDLDTFIIFPWRPQQGKVARLICDIYRSNGLPFEGDSRYLLKKVLKEAEEMGYFFHVGPECEFFLFPTDENENVILNSKEQGGYFDISPLDQGENVRRDIVLNLEDMGFEVETSYHEKAPCQHEIDFKYGEALKSADNILAFRMTVRVIAKRHGLHATFMPKPRNGINGSGMHLNMSISDKDGNNLFADDNDPNGLSELAYHFMAGIFKHIHGMTAITNPIVNSYKRLRPGFEAPVYIAWSSQNRSPLIRIPSVKGKNTRLELRCPDSVANPYLTIAVCLAAGLEGMKERLIPPNSVNKNIFAMTSEERKELGITRLPSTLGGALDAMSQDPFFRKVLGNYIFEKYLDAKKKEWNSYRDYVSDWEMNEYLHKF